MTALIPVIYQRTRASLLWQEEQFATADGKQVRVRFDRIRKQTVVYIDDDISFTMNVDRPTIDTYKYASSRRMLRAMGYEIQPTEVRLFEGD